MEQLEYCDKEQHGLFVFQTLCKVEVRYEPCESSRTCTWFFERGQLVAADLKILILASNSSDSSGSGSNDNDNNSYFVRLTDHAGWLMTKRHGQALLRAVPVKTNKLWDVWVVAASSATASSASSSAAASCCTLLRHPVDRSDLQYSNGKKPITYQPLRRLTCDAHVVHPSSTTGGSSSGQQLHYYRVQGTAGWVVDRRLTESGNDRILLVPHHALQFLDPLAAFVALDDICIHRQPTTSTSSSIDNNEQCDKGRCWIRAGDVVLVNAILKLDGNSNGLSTTFLHLEGSHGWIRMLEQQPQMLQDVAIESGQWTLRVVMMTRDAKGGGGVAPLLHRRQPFWTTTNNNAVPQAAVVAHSVSHNDALKCDQRIQSPTTGAWAYRVKGSRDWVVFDLKDIKYGDSMLQLVTKPLSPGSSSTSGPNAKDKDHDVDVDEWTPDFVRRIAAPIDGLEEVLFDKSHHVMSFVKGKTKINVHYDTKTVGTVVGLLGPNETELMRRNCSAKALADIFERPLVPTETNGRHYLKKDQQPQDSSSGHNHNDKDGAAEAIEQATANRQQVEGQLRKNLLECDKHVQELQQRRQNLLKSLKVYDQERAQEAESLLHEHGVPESNHEERVEPTAAQEQEENKQQVKEAPQQVEQPGTSKLGEKLPEKTAPESKAAKEQPQTVEQQPELSMTELQKLDHDDNDGFVHRPLKKAPVLRTQTSQEAQQPEQGVSQANFKDVVNELREMVHEREPDTKPEQQEEEVDSKMHQQKEEEAQSSSDQEPSEPESDLSPKKYGNLETSQESEFDDKPAERTALDSKTNERPRTAQQQSELPTNELQKLDDDGFVYRPLKKAPVLRTKRPQSPQQTNEEEPLQVDEDDGIDELRKLVLESETKAKREQQEKEPERKMHEHEKKASAQEAVDREAYSAQEPDSSAKKNPFRELDLESSPTIFRPLKANPTLKKAVHQSMHADTNHETAAKDVQEDATVQSTPREVDPEVNLICGKCQVEFPTAGTRREHCLQEHGLYSCNFCTQVFSSTYYLNEHRDAQDHW